MKTAKLVLQVLAALLLFPVLPAAQEPPELSVGEPILSGKSAQETAKALAPKNPVLAPDSMPGSVEEKYFTVTLPDGWKKKSSAFGRAAKKKKVYGVEAAGPAGAEGLLARISVYYYSPGNLLQKTHEEFIKRHCEPPAGAGADAGEYGKVKDEELAGRPARCFDRIVFERVPPTGAKSKKVPVYEYFTVVPARAGFFVLKYYAPKNIAKANITVYEKLLDSFVPLVK